MASEPAMTLSQLHKHIDCVEGRLMRHDPQPDDPYLQTDVGECPDCSGDGCGDDGEAVSKAGRSQRWLP